MKKDLLLGFDAGTYESKGTLCDTDGRVLATAFSPHLLKTPKPGWAEHDPLNDWWGDFRKIVSELLENTGAEPARIAGIGISTVMAGIVPVDEACRPLRNAILYGIDSRAQKQVEDLKREIGEETMRRKIGNVVGQESFGPKIRWIHDNEPEVYAAAGHFTIASGFLTARLTGRYAVDCYSATSALPMYNSFTRNWDEELTPSVCRIGQLPEIVRTTDVIGTVTREAARETGLAEGTPVIAGTTDAAAEAVSVGVVDPGDMMLMYGSTMFIIRPAGPGKGSRPYVIEGREALTAGTATSGTLTRWLRDQLGRDLVEKEAAGGANAYAALFAEAEGIPAGSEGLIVLPYFLGERMPLNDPGAKGVFFGLNLRHTRGHLVKAALEGIGCSLDQNLELFRRAGASVDRATAVGGGTKARLWLQTVSDICGITQAVPEVTVGASYGDAMLAGIGIGAMTPESIRKAVKIRDIIEPDREKQAVYGPLKKIYAELYTRNADLMHRL